MRKTKITALALGLIMVAATLSGCSEEPGTSMNYVDVGALQNASLPEITAVNLENDGNSGADPDGSGGADPGNSSGGQPSESSGGASSGESSGASSGESAPVGIVAPAENKTAEIVIPNTSEYGVYIAEHCEFDPEKVKTAILGDVSITPEITENRDSHTNEDYKIYTWKKDDIVLWVNCRSWSFDLTSELSYVADHILYKPNKNHDGNIEAFKRLDEPLDFCTPEQAVSDIRGKLAECGFNVSADADVYALHQDEMQQAIDELCAEGHFNDPKEMRSKGNAKPLASYTVDKSDECYYIVFNEEFGGVPIYNYIHNFETINGLDIFPPEITAVYSSDGLMGLMVNHYRGKITESEKVTQLITPQSAVQAVTAKYSDIGASEVEFDKVELMYVLTPNTIDGKINTLKAKLTPAWVCTAYYTIWTTDKRQAEGVKSYVTSKETVLIDAVTGAEII